jgi:hypothetical protein
MNESSYLARRVFLFQLDLHTVELEKPLRKIHEDQKMFLAQ